MAYRQLTSLIILAASLVAPPVVRAQSPWIVSLVPTRNPLPIGGCAAVRLQLTDPITKDSPRNPKGNYVSLADFDLAVTAADPRSVAGQYDGASLFSACACQGAVVGSIATVTATYPATTLAPKARVPGVAFQASANFALAKANGANDPQACALPRPGVVAASTSGAGAAGSAAGAGAGAAAGGGAAGAAGAAGGAAGGASASGGGAAAGATGGAASSAAGGAAGAAQGSAAGGAAASNGARGAAGGSAGGTAAAGGASSASGGAAAGAAAGATKKTPPRKTVPIP